MSSSSNVLIIGAGIAGLTLAQTLRKARVPFRIFERDPSPDARPQGWALSLHWFDIPARIRINDSGNVDLASRILTDLLPSIPEDLPPLEELSVTHPIGLHSHSCAYDSDSGKRLVSWGSARPSDPQHFVRISRAKCRSWLSTGVTIEWGKKFGRFEEGEAGVKVFFEDGTSTSGSAIVGADGINSPVRRQLFHATETDLNHLPIGALIGKVQVSKAEYQKQLALGRSTYIVFGENSRLITALGTISEDQETATYYWVLSWPDSDAENPANYRLNKLSHEHRLDVARQKSEPLDAKFTEALRRTRAEDINPIAIRDLEPSPIPLGRVTLVGDAWHPMTFMGGVGANHAMLDALDLGRLFNLERLRRFHLESEPKGMDWRWILGEYSKKAFPRGKEAVLASRTAAIKQNSRRRPRL